MSSSSGWSNSEGWPSPKKARVESPKRAPSLSSVRTGEAEELAGTGIQEVIWHEFEKISDMYSTDKVQVPRELYKKIFELIEMLTSGKKFPSELVLETDKSLILQAILFQIVKHFQKNAASGELKLGDETTRTLNGLNGRMDYSVIKRLGDKIYYLLAFEVKAEGCRHALKQMLLYLKRIKELNPQLDVRLKSEIF